LEDGFRCGASYQFNPTPREFNYEDPHHTKLADGRAWGYFGTTVAWSKAIDEANVVFDLHRPYRIVKVELAQPAKLEDRRGGPTELTLSTDQGKGDWRASRPFEANFAVAMKTNSEPGSHANPLNDPRHGRAWLSWRAQLPGEPVRRLRIEMRRVHRNSSISLGEAVVWGLFDGGVRAAVQLGGRKLRINKGRRWTVPARPTATTAGFGR
jgi:hypothetical protein